MRDERHCPASVPEVPRSEAQRSGDRDHRDVAGVNRFDDLGVVDALEVDGGS
jgi:hypothetical protein